MRATASLFTQTNFRGRSRTVRTPMSNLAIIHMNDQVRSIRINGRSGPWQICTNANFRGHCAIFTRSVSDTGRFGMRNSVSSIRPR